jgi:hypothetical protein
VTQGQQDTYGSVVALKTVQAGTLPECPSNDTLKHKTDVRVQNETGAEQITELCIQK